MHHFSTKKYVNLCLFINLYTFILKIMVCVNIKETTLGLKYKGNYKKMCTYVIKSIKILIKKKD